MSRATRRIAVTALAGLGLLVFSRCKPLPPPIKGTWVSEDQILELHIKPNLEADLCIGKLGIQVRLLGVDIERDAFDAYHVRVAGPVARALESVLDAVPDPKLLGVLSATDLVVADTVRRLEYILRFCRFDDDARTRMTCVSALSDLALGDGAPIARWKRVSEDYTPCVATDATLCSDIPSIDQIAIVDCLLKRRSGAPSAGPRNLCDVLAGASLTDRAACLPGAAVVAEDVDAALSAACVAVDRLDQLDLGRCVRKELGAVDLARVCSAQTTDEVLACVAKGAGSTPALVGSLVPELCATATSISPAALPKGALPTCVELTKLDLFDLACCNSGDGGAGGGEPPGAGGSSGGGADGGASGDASPEAGAADAGSEEGCAALGCPLGEICCQRVTPARCYSPLCFSCCP